MIRPDDLSVAADSLAANGTPAGPAGVVVHAAGVCTDTLDGGLRAAEALSDSFAAADSLPQPPFRTLFRPRFRRWSRSRRPNGR